MKTLCIATALLLLALPSTAATPGGKSKGKAPAPVAAPVVEAPPPPEPPPPAPPPVEAEKAPEARRALRLAVYDLVAEGVEPRLARIVADAVVLEVRKLERLSVVNMEDVRAMLDLEAQKQLVGCGDDSCLSEIADSLGVDGVVVGSLARVGDEHIFSLRRIDQRQAKTLGQVTRRFAAETGEEFLAAVGPAIEELFPDVPLRAGQTRGVAIELARRVNPPPLSPWVFYGTAAVGSGVALGAAVALTWNIVLAQQVAARQELATTTPQPGKEIADLRAQNDGAAAAALGLGGVAVAVGVGAAVVGLFTDWQGDGSDP